jgi:hypothetical protein
MSAKLIDFYFTQKHLMNNLPASLIKLNAIIHHQSSRAGQLMQWTPQ